MNRKRFFYYWAVVLALAVIVLIVLLIASSRSTQALDVFPVRVLHGMLAPGFMLFLHHPTFHNTGCRAGYAAKRTGRAGATP